MNKSIAIAPYHGETAQATPANGVKFVGEIDTADEVERDLLMPRNPTDLLDASTDHPALSSLFDDMSTGLPTVTHPQSRIEPLKSTNNMSDPFQLGRLSSKEQNETVAEGLQQSLAVADSPQPSRDLFSSSSQVLAAHVPKTLSTTIDAESIFHDAVGTNSFLGPSHDDLFPSLSKSTSDCHSDFKPVENATHWPDYMLEPSPNQPLFEPLGRTHRPLERLESDAPNNLTSGIQQRLFNSGVANTLEGRLTSDGLFPESNIDNHGTIDYQQRNEDQPPVSLPRVTTGDSSSGPQDAVDINDVNPRFISDGNSEKCVVSMDGEEGSLLETKLKTDIMTLASTAKAPQSKRSSNSSLISNYSGISTAISHLSGYSASHKAQMKSLVRAFSSSTFSLSSTRTSRYSRTSDEDLELSKQDEPMRAEMSEPKGYPHLSELPGAFITADVNIFANHVDCRLEEPQLFSPLACEGCCLKPNRWTGEKKHSVPYAVMRYKRGVYRLEDWSSMKIDWTDRFGNTTIHIAAAMRADYQHLSSLIDRGAKVNYVNTAGQTFMHLLDPRQLLDNDMPKLLEKLVQSSFKFETRDVQGRTFLHVLEANYGIYPRHYWRWLKLLWSRDNEGRPNRHMFAHRVQNCFPIGSAQADQLSSFVTDFNEFQDQEKHIGRWGDFFSNPFSKVMGFGGGKMGFHIVAVNPSMNIPSSTTDQLIITGTNINFYDDTGETPLMAHVRLWRGEDADNETLLRTLVNLGASTTQRNRDFASPLHLAVRSGNILATKILLEQCNVNVHARDRHGKGVIAVGIAEQRQSRRDSKSYAKITACIALAIDAGAISEPSLFDEWSLPKHKNARASVVDSYSHALYTVIEDGRTSDESGEKSLVLPGGATEPSHTTMVDLVHRGHGEEAYWVDLGDDEYLLNILYPDPIMAPPRVPDKNAFSGGIGLDFLAERAKTITHTGKSEFTDHLKRR